MALDDGDPTLRIHALHVTCSSRLASGRIVWSCRAPLMRIQVLQPSQHKQPRRESGAWASSHRIPGRTAASCCCVGMVPEELPYRGSPSFLEIEHEQSVRRVSCGGRIHHAPYTTRPQISSGCRVRQSRGAFSRSSPRTSRRPGRWS